MHSIFSVVFMSWWAKCGLKFDPEMMFSFLRFGYMQDKNIQRQRDAKIDSFHLIISSKQK